MLLDGFVVSMLFFLAAMVARAILGSWVAPATVYCLVWGGVIALFSVRLVNYNALPVSAWLIISTIMGTLLLGAVSSRLALRMKSRRLSERGLGPARETVARPYGIGTIATSRVREVVMGFGAVSILVALGVFIETARALGAPYSIGWFIDNARAVRAMAMSGTVDLGVLGYLGAVGYGVAPLSGYLIARNGFRDPVAYVPLAPAALSDITLGGRTSIVVSLVLMVVGMVYGYKVDGKRLPWRRVAAWGVTGVLVLSLLLAFLNTIRGHRQGPESPFGGPFAPYARIRIDLPGWKIFDSFLSNYVYATAGIGGLAAVLEAPPPLSWGSLTFAPMVRAMARLLPLEPPPRYGEMLEIPVRVNSASFWSPLYQDFGLLGVLVAAYLLGWMSTGAFESMRRGSVAGFIVATYLTTALATSTYFYLGGLGWVVIGLGSGLIASALLAAKRTTLNVSGRELQ